MYVFVIADFRIKQLQEQCATNSPVRRSTGEKYWSLSSKAGPVSRSDPQTYYPRSPTWSSGRRVKSGDPISGSKQQGQVGATRKLPAIQVQSTQRKELPICRKRRSTDPSGRTEPVMVFRSSHPGLDHAATF